MFQEGLEEHNIHEKDTHLEVLSNYPCGNEEKIKELGTQSDE